MSRLACGSCAGFGLMCRLDETHACRFRARVQAWDSCASFGAHVQTWGSCAGWRFMCRLVLMCRFGVDMQA